MSPKFSILALAALMAGGAATFAMAQSQENDAQAIQNAHISLSQAITAAEKKVGGKAARAEFEQSKQQSWIYEVEVVNGSKVFDVDVDPQSGKVLSSRPDTVDQDDEQNEQGEQE